MFLSFLLFCFSLRCTVSGFKQNFFKFMEKTRVLYQVREIVNSHTFVCHTRIQQHLLTTQQLHKDYGLTDRLAWGWEGGEAVASYGMKTKTESHDRM